MLPNASIQFFIVYIRNQNFTLIYLLVRLLLGKHKSHTRTWLNLWPHILHPLFMGVKMLFGLKIIGRGYLPILSLGKKFVAYAMDQDWYG
jgi:hypothetical protein